MLGGVGVACADVLVLQGFELLLGAEFVGLERLLLIDSLRPGRWAFAAYHVKICEGAVLGGRLQLTSCLVAILALAKAVWHEL